MEQNPIAKNYFQNCALLERPKPSVPKEWGPENVDIEDVLVEFRIVASKSGASKTPELADGIKAVAGLETGAYRLGKY